MSAISEHKVLRHGMWTTIIKARLNESFIWRWDINDITRLKIYINRSLEQYTIIQGFPQFTCFKGQRSLTVAISVITGSWGFFEVRSQLLVMLASTELDR